MTLTKHHLLLCCLALSEASSSNGSSGNFMVMSEVTVPLNDRGDAISDTGSSSADRNNQSTGDDRETTGSGILNDESASSGNFDSSNAGGSGSDTDEEDEDEPKEPQPPAPAKPQQPNTQIALDASVSQPLRTLKKLQAMLDDSDYATSAVTPASAIESHNLDQEALYPEDNKPTQHQEPDKLWTRQDRAKYRRTRRAEKQRRDYEQQRAIQYRDIERTHIIRAEREREELEDLRRKQMEVLELQRRESAKREAMQRQFMEEFTDDETDTDGMGFELPNLPVYLSDGETEEFEEEGSDDQFQQKQGRNRANVQQYSQVTRRVAQVQQMPQYQYAQPPRNTDYSNYRAQQRPQPPPPQRPPPQFNYRQPPPQQEQQQGYSTNYPQQYQYDPNQQQISNQQQGAPPQQYQYPNQQEMEQQQRQYEHQYTVWAQAAANGYYYPPPTPPVAYQQQQRQQNQQSQNQQYTPPFRLPYQPYEGYQPPQYGQAYPSFLPQQRATVPGTQTSAPINQHHGNQGFFPRDNQAAREWMQQQQPQTAQRDISVQSIPSQSDGSSTATLNDALQPSNSLGEPQNVSPLISTDPTLMVPVNAEGPYCEMKDESAVIIAGAESKITFDSIQKLVFSAIGVSLLSYCAVSPRSLPFPEYNRLFLQNLLTVGLGALPPMLMMLCVYDGKYNNINTMIGTFHVSFTLGYTMAFVSEIILTTLLRLAVFLLWEPAIFSLTPEVPTIILPWVLREKQYRPKRITLFACDFGASCIASPIIEEYLKLKIVQWTAFLPRNFKPTKKKVQKGKRKKKKDALQPIFRNGDEVTNINCYVSQMMAASLGLKLFDTTRRILMYTKKSDDYKHFYAVCRGVFPIHELCGTMTALLLARRNVLGVNTSLWKILGPAVFIHGMANFRGMKPIFKWGSAAPWAEMQLYPWKVGSNFTLKQLLSTSYAKIVWCTILLRVFGFCVKNYYLIGRQAMKRVTTYSGKLYAFSAKLETDAVLKRAKEK